MMDIRAYAAETAKRFSFQQSSPKMLIERSIEWLLVFTLSAIPYMIFYTTRLKSSYDYISILLLTIWLIVIRGRTENALPRYLIMAALFYAVSFLISAGISSNKSFLVSEADCLRIPALAGLLYTMPFRTMSRKIIIIAFLSIAASMGIVALFQYFGVYFQRTERPSGFLDMSGIYAGMLSFAFGVSVIMLALRQKSPFRTTYERAFLSVVILCTLSGIVLYQSRGLWLAFVISLVAVISFIDRRKAIVTVITLLLGISILFGSNAQLRHRAATIVTSFYTEKTYGSTWERLELWKAAWIIFLRHPVFGTGVWDFPGDVQQLIAEGKVNNIPTYIHAHNTYMHNLATRGIVGLVATVALLAALLIWGWSLTKKTNSEVGGYIVMFCTLIMILSGMTEVSFADGAPYAFAYWYTIGLCGPIQTEKAI